MKLSYVCPVLLSLLITSVTGCERTPLDPNAKIVVDSISVSPPWINMRVGDSILFRATVYTPSGTTTRVNWSSVFGNIGRDGYYSPTQTTQTDTITAIPIDNTRKSAKAIVRISPPVDWPLGTILNVPLTTYVENDSLGQTVHPDIITFDRGFRGHHCLLVVTPYPYGNSRFENPSVFSSGECLTSWSVPAGLTNPIVLPRSSNLLVGAAAMNFRNVEQIPEFMIDPGEAREFKTTSQNQLALSPPTTNLRGGFLSDPEWAYNPAMDRLRIYFRQYVGVDIIFMMESEDAISWNTPQEVMRAPGAGALSPTIVLKDGGWEMWFVDASPIGCFTNITRVKRATSNDGLAWSQATTVNLAQPGYIIWHIKVRYIPEWQEYWAIYNAYPASPTTGCAKGELFFARSSDGVNWENFLQPIIRHNDVGQFRNGGLYRATFLYSPADSIIQIWASGNEPDRNHGLRWGEIAVGYKISSLLARLNR